MFAGSNWDVENPNSYTVIDMAIKEFESMHTNVKVTYISGIPKEDYSEWLAERMLKGKTPDVFMILKDDFDKFSSMGILKNLDLLIEQDEDFNTDDYYATTYYTGKYLGTQYALPYETVPELMFVNKSLLMKEGNSVPDNNWTWDDFYRICSEVTKDTDADGTIDQFGVYDYTWEEAVYSNGAELFNNAGTEAYFTDEKVLDSISFIKKLYQLNNETSVTRGDFEKGRVAFMPLLFSDYRTYKTYPYKLKKYTNFEWDCVALPSGPDGDNTSTVNTLLMGINNHTKNEKLSWEFLKLLTYDKDIQKNIFNYSQGISVLKEVTKSDEAESILLKNMESSSKAIDNNMLDRVIDKGVIEPKFRKYSDAMILADSEITKIIDEDKNIDSAMKTLQRDITSFLRR
jgi:multiple sugar transport system substrate-binding protein